MILRRIAPLSIAALLAAAPTCPQQYGPADLIGSWGGQHIGLVMTEAGGTLEYDCAHGTIGAQPRIAAGGSFVASGTHVREHGGPIRDGEPPDAHPAEYTGRVRGDDMTITVRETDTGTAVGTFTLKRGAAARVLKCL